MIRQSIRKNILALLVGVFGIHFGLGMMLSQACAAEENGDLWPAVPGAVFALRNVHPASPNVTLDSQGSELLAFEIATKGRSLIGRNYDLVCDGGSFVAEEAGSWIGSQVAKSGAFTLEAVITPAKAAPESAGAIISYGDDAHEDVALLQDRAGLSLRWGNAKPISLFPLDGNKQVHVIVACDQQGWTAYRDGKAVASGVRPAEAQPWGPHELVMGNTVTGAGAWYGKMEGVAIFARALTHDEAAAEVTAFKQLIAKRKASTPIRFRGVLVRQAQTPDLKAIEPYTRSMTAAEYKIEQVIEGEWAKPTIVVLHWMIMDSKRLPIAERKPGEKVELVVEPLEQHPQLESNRRDEDFGDDVVSDIFYCESEGKQP